MATPIPTVGAFKAKHSEFAATPEGLCREALIEAAANTNAPLFGEKLTPVVVMLQAALILYNSPFAREMRKEYEPTVTGYERLLKRYQRNATFALRVW